MSSRAASTTTIRKFRDRSRQVHHHPEDGTVVKWTINANENNNYQNKLDEALLSQDSAADDDKIDIFLIEADYALKYVDSDYVLDVKADIGLTDDDLAGPVPVHQGHR